MNYPKTAKIASIFFLGFLSSSITYGCLCEHTKSFFTNITDEHIIVRAKVLKHVERTGHYSSIIPESITILEIIEDYTEKLEGDTIVFENGNPGLCRATISSTKENSEIVLKGIPSMFGFDEFTLRLWNIPDSIVKKEPSFFNPIIAYPSIDYTSCDIGALSLNSSFVEGNITCNAHIRRNRAAKARGFFNEKWSNNYRRTKQYKLQKMPLRKFERKLKRKIKAL